MSDIRTVEYRGNKYFFHETPTLNDLIREVFNDNYRVLERGVNFSPGDVVVDIGANEGLFSIMMAKMFPYIKVVGCEPVPRTFFQALRNIGLNGLSNVEIFNVGVGAKDDRIKMVVANEFSGGSSGVQQKFDPTKNKEVEVSILSLDNFLRMARGADGRIHLMKMDIEGMEYDALYGSSALTDVDYFVGEFHINTFLKEVKGRDMKELATYVGSKTNLIYYESCRMAD